MTTKERQPDWKETNMSLFGSDIEKKIKAAAADGEPQWDDAGKKVGLQIWRIEQFKVKKWPSNKHGKFHRGDSYIVLNTFIANPDINPDKLAWDVHFWIGSESTQDEYGTAAYKTVELDDKLGGDPVQHREVEQNESDLFLKYFPKGITYLEGGVESGFKSAADRDLGFTTTMYQVKGRATNILLSETPLSRSAMNSGDVFILDTEEVIYQWNGNQSNAQVEPLTRYTHTATPCDELSPASPSFAHPRPPSPTLAHLRPPSQEKSQAKEICLGMRGDRGGKPKIETLDEGTDGMDKNEGMWAFLPGERKLMGIKIADIKIQTAEKGGSDEKVEAFQMTLYRVKEGGGVSRVHRGKAKPPVNLLKSNHVYLLDTGFEVYLWMGGKAPSALRGSAFPYAQKYLKSYKRPPVLPIHQNKEGKEQSKFKTFLGPEEPEACCACIIA